MNNEFIPIMTERIVQEFDPLQIILFGSQARGDADRDSDIDLLVVFAELTDKRKTAIDLDRALSDVPVAKDIIVSTPRSWNAAAPGSAQCCGMPNKRVKSFGSIGTQPHIAIYPIRK